MTDSWSERPIPTEPADSQAMTRRVPQGATSDSPGHDPAAAVPATGAPLRPKRPAAFTPAQAAARTQPRTPISGDAASKATAKGGTANPASYVWDSALASEDGPGAGPVAPPAARPPAGPPESKRSSLRRIQWAAEPAEQEAADDGGDGDPPAGPPEGPGGGPRGRGTRVGLVFLGALAVAALLIWVITSTMPKSPAKAAVTADDGTGAAPTHALLPLGASPIAVLSGTAKPSPAATRITLPAAPHSTASQRPAAVRTTARASGARPSTAPASSAPAAPAPPTVDVQIADSDDKLVIDVDNSGTSAGTLVGTWAVDNTPAQHWHLVAQPNGSYVIYSELADLKLGLEINVNTDDYKGDTVTTLQPYDGAAAMQWTAKYLGAGEYELINAYNGQCLTSGGQGVSNATIGCDTSDAYQAWTITG